VLEPRIRTCYNQRHPNAVSVTVSVGVSLIVGDIHR
jgi:hypothetical protein